MLTQATLPRAQDARSWTTAAGNKRGHPTMGGNASSGTPRSASQGDAGDESRAVPPMCLACKGSGRVQSAAGNISKDSR